ncbi:MAG: metallophosphoesterase [Chloroflexi bacterium]|nr:metallophosphoesterase [Chloroflexota bacterium]
MPNVWQRDGARQWFLSLSRVRLQGIVLLGMKARCAIGILTCLLALVMFAPRATYGASPIVSTRFAIIGDFGLAGAAENDVANLVTSWNPEFIATVGDNNYPLGAAATIDANIGQYYHDFIAPYTGSYGAGAATNRFYPTPGNHDWYTANAQPYLDYFTLPGNERYYDFVWGNVHLFMLDSDANEPDGITSVSTQATWLQSRLGASTARWKLVLLHHAPYSSSSAHGSNPTLQWNYAGWGASAVIAGHDHTYERILKNGLPYFVNGLGGYPGIYGFKATPETGSAVRYNADFGALRVSASDANITFEFINRAGAVIDTYSLNKVYYFPLIAR